MPGDYLTIGTATLDSHGVCHYPVTASYQQSTNDLRLVLPSDGVNSQTRFLWVMPVQAGTPSNYTIGGHTYYGNYTYGDGLAAAQSSGLHDHHKLIIVAPSFDYYNHNCSNGLAPDPWYGDHPTTATIRQESYITAMVPVVQGLFPQASPQNLLLGFSKSGWGSLNLLFQHPHLFAAAAVWDAPLMMNFVVPSPYPGVDLVFGNNTYFQQNYQLDTHLSSYGAAFQKSTRIWLGINPGGQNNFQLQMAAFDEHMTAYGMAHAACTFPRTLTHAWPSGWVPDAMAFLIG